MSAFVIRRNDDANAATWCTANVDSAFVDPASHRALIDTLALSQFLDG